MNKMILHLCLLLAGVFSSMKSVSNEEIKNNEPDNDVKPLFLLNGKSIGNNPFAIKTQGTLELVKDESESDQRIRIPFRVYLMRENITINSRNLEFLNPVYSLDVSKLLALAKPGDQLILEPVYKEHLLPKRILTIVTKAGC